MITHNATLAKKNNDDEIEHIHPRTTADLVKYSDDKSVKEKIDELESATGELDRSNYYNKLEIEELIYVPIHIEELDISPKAAEKGSNTNVTVSWRFNKEPSTFKINSDNVTPSVKGSITFNNINSSQIYNITVSDNGNSKYIPSTDSNIIGIKFFNAIYYGVSITSDTLNSSFINSLSKSIQDDCICTFTINVGTDQYVWFACPKEYNPSFYVNGFNGGFIFISNIEYTNSYGYTETYSIYRSHYDGLGNITVEVK